MVDKINIIDFIKSKKESEINIDIEEKVNIENYNNSTIKDLTTHKMGIVDKIIEMERELKGDRIKMRDSIIKILVWQLVVSAAFIFWVFCNKNKGFYSTEEFTAVINFILVYLSLVTVEIIAIVFFIVRYLFSTKLVEIIENMFKNLSN